MRLRFTSAIASATVLLSLQLRYGLCEPQPSPEFGQAASYDYVVIGGGTAGLTIASRLAEVASVAVIEAGGYYEQDNGNLSVVPGLALQIPFLDTTPQFPPKPSMDWGYVSVPQREAGNRSIHYAQGKTLGGSSAINTMAYHRATYGAYQRWADLVGDQSYQFLNLLQYFEKSSHLTPPDFAKRKTPNATFLYDPLAFNILNGPLQVSWGTYVDATITWLAKGIQYLGLPESLVGFNSGFLLGYGAYITSTVDPSNATRSSSQTSYLETIGKPAGLAVYHNTQALQIVFNNNKAATGVQVSSQNVTSPYTLTAKKEVILSAGAFGSPHLLMVSGVGPEATLKKYNIPVISTLSGVGQNLWDQIYFGVIHAVTTPSGAQETALHPYQVLDAYKQRALGPLSSISAYISFEKIPLTLRQGFSSATKTALGWFPTDWPEVEYIAASSVTANGTSLGVLSASLVAPLSRGNVTIRSSSPLVYPVIDMGWLTNPADAEVAVAALKRARQAWADISNITIGEEVAPGPTVQSDEDILEYIKQTATQIWHAGATCAMGKAGNPDGKAVVDSKGKVFGVSRLRVVDSSAFPFQVPGHPQSTVYMLAEKIAADIINGI